MSDAKGADPPPPSTHAANTASKTASKTSSKPSRDERLIAAYIRVMAATAEASGQRGLATWLGRHAQSIERGDTSGRAMIAACVNIAEGQGSELLVHVLRETPCPHGPN